MLLNTSEVRHGVERSTSQQRFPNPRSSARERLSHCAAVHWKGPHHLKPSGTYYAKEEGDGYFWRNL